MIVAASASSSMREVRHVLASKPPDQVVLLVPSSQEQYEKFLRATDGLIENPLPPFPTESDLTEGHSSGLSAFSLSGEVATLNSAAGGRRRLWN
jgi:hypothetical protein